MAGSLNKVMLIGNLGKDPEIRTFEGGNSLARFPIATSETYTNKQTNERVTQTEWHTVVLRRGLAEVAEKYLHKGDKIFVEGKIKTRSWDDDRGERKYATEIQVDNMTMLSGKKEEGSGSSGDTPSQSVDISKGADEDDLPF
jgi:single-strand DNA-binding protein